MKAKSLLSSLKIPVIQAPMAGGISSPELVASVANAGGVGSFGFAYSSAARIYEDLQRVALLSKGYINANFFVPSQRSVSISSIDHVIQQQALQVLQEMSFSQDLKLQIPTGLDALNLDEQLEPVWKLKPAMLTFHFGIPNANIIQQAHNLDILVGISATCLSEAAAIEEAGGDFIVAQGVEAGGHRGTFYPDAEDSELTLSDLMNSLKGQINIPIVAAGGIMTGSDIHSFLQLGCSAVQMGTAFLTCHEAGTHPSYKNVLLQEHHRGTCFTKGFSGRRARGLRNVFTEYMADKPHLPFPIQNTMTTSIRQKAIKLSNPEYQSLWAGSNYTHCQSLTVDELISKLENELSKARRI